MCVTCRMLHSLHHELEPVESGMEFSATNTPQKAGADDEAQEVAHACMPMHVVECTFIDSLLCLFDAC